MAYSRVLKTIKDRHGIVVSDSEYMPMNDVYHSAQVGQHIASKIKTNASGFRFEAAIRNKWRETGDITETVKLIMKLHPNATMTECERHFNHLMKTRADYIVNGREAREYV